MVAAMDDKAKVNSCGTITDPATGRLLADLCDDMAALLEQEARDKRGLAEAWRALR